MVAFFKLRGLCDTVVLQCPARNKKDIHTYERTTRTGTRTVDLNMRGQSLTTVELARVAHRGLVYLSELTCASSHGGRVRRRALHNGAGGGLLLLVISRDQDHILPSTQSRERCGTKKFLASESGPWGREAGRGGSCTGSTQFRTPCRPFRLLRSTKSSRHFVCRLRKRDWREVADGS